MEIRLEVLYMELFPTYPKLIGDISIHTFSIYHTLHYKEYNDIFEHLKKVDYNGLWPEECPASYISLPMLEIEKGLRVQLRNHTVCSINVIVSPLLLVQKQEDDYKRIAPVDPAFWNDVYGTLDDAFMQLEFPFDVYECSLSRADLCMNLEMGLKFDIPTYLYYLKRTPCKKGYVLQSFDDPEKDMYSYKVQNTMQALAVYAKSAQQENCFDALPDGSNILRIELQLKNKKIGKTYAGPPAWEALLNLVAHAPEAILKGIHLILPTGDYRTGNDAYQVIFNSDCRTKVKNELWELILQYSKAQNQAEQIKISNDYIAEKSQKKFDKRMYALNNLNIAPICLNDGEKIDYLPSLYNLATIAQKQFSFIHNHGIPHLTSNYSKFFFDFL